MLAETTDIIPVEVRHVAASLPDVVSRSLAPIEAKVDVIDETTGFDDIANTLGLIADIKRLLEEKRDQVEAAAVAYIKAHGEQTIGDVRYFVGFPKTVKPRDLRAAVEALMTATGGDFARFTDCLSAGALKHGECRKVFEAAGTPQRYAEVFETKSEPKLEEGKPAAKRLQKVDQKFLK